MAPPYLQSAIRPAKFGRGPACPASQERPDRDTTMTSLPKNGFNIDLSGSWQLASVDGEIRTAIILPGDVHTCSTGQD